MKQPRIRYIAKPLTNVWQIVRVEPNGREVPEEYHVESKAKERAALLDRRAARDVRAKEKG
jgi:hypothetical protein